MSDVNGDGKEDVVGFFNQGAYVSLSTGDGFSQPKLWVEAFGKNTGWGTNARLRYMSDVNGDGKQDVVGFSHSGVFVSISDGNTFKSPTKWISAYGYRAGNWRKSDHKRTLSDTNGDGKADVVGFGNAGVYVSTSR